MDEHPQRTVPASQAPWLIRPRSVGFVLIIAIFVILGVLVGTGVTSVPDINVSKYFNSIQGSHGQDYAMVIVASTGDVTALVLLGIILTIIRRTRKAGMIFLIAIVAVTVVIMYVKPLVGRHVPPDPFSPSLKLPNGAIEPDSLAPPADRLSFPSAHAAAATSLAFIAGQGVYARSRGAAYTLWAFPVITGIARLYIGQHYPTDIAGGILLGFAVSAFLASIMKLQIPFSMSQLRGSSGAVSDASRG